MPAFAKDDPGKPVAPIQRPAPRPLIPRKSPYDPPLPQ